MAVPTRVARVNPGFLRLVTRVAAVGAMVVGRAAVSAYKEAAAEGAKRHKAGGGAGTMMNAITGRSPRPMSAPEAYKILGLKDVANPAEVDSAADRLIAQNDPGKGGSFYLQSKVIRAREFLEAEGLLKAGDATGEEGGEGAKDDAASDKKNNQQ